MIQVIINMDPQSGNLSIGSEAPPLLVWSVVCAAYYEMLSKKIQADMDRAGKTGITDPTAGNKIWAQVDKEVTDQAPWVSMYNPKYIDFLSSRVKGYQFSPQWYFLIDQASVK